MYDLARGHRAGKGVGAHIYTPSMTHASARSAPEINSMGRSAGASGFYIERENVSNIQKQNSAGGIKIISDKYRSEKWLKMPLEERKVTCYKLHSKGFIRFGFSNSIMLRCLWL
jgi:hypothetical protein